MRGHVLYVCVIGCLQKSGKELFSWGHKSGVRACQFAHGERMFLSVQDNTFSQVPTIFIYNLAEDLKDRQKNNKAHR